MKEVVIAGAGAHCKVVLDVILDSREYRPIGLLDGCGEKELLGVPVIGTDERLEELFASGVRYAFAAVGDNRIRERIARRMEAVGYELITPVSRHAAVSSFARIEAGTVVMPGAVVNACAHIGRGCILNTNCSVDHDCEIGDFVHIAPGCAISGTVTIGRGSFIGTGARIIDRVTVGEQVMLGAGAAAVRDLPGRCTAVGVPAKIIKKG